MNRRADEVIICVKMVLILNGFSISFKIGSSKINIICHYETKNNFYASAHGDSLFQKKIIILIGSTLDSAFEIDKYFYVIR